YRQMECHLAMNVGGQQNLNRNNYELEKILLRIHCSLHLHLLLRVVLSYSASERHLCRTPARVPTVGRRLQKSLWMACGGPTRLCLCVYADLCQRFCQWRSRSRPKTRYYG